MKMNLNYKSLIISTLITCVFIFSGYSIFAQGKTEPYFDYSNPEKGYLLVKSSYHYSMNHFFNEKLSQINDLLKIKDFYKDEKIMQKLNPPAGDLTLENFETLCENNLSTYCVSLEAMSLYLQYLETLQKITNTIKTDTLELAEYSYVQLLQNPTHTTLINTIRSRNQAIAKEITEAKMVMSGTLSAYDEFKQAYPMHKKYLEIIDTLIKFRKALEITERQIKKFPQKFIDVTSSSCE